MRFTDENQLEQPTGEGCGWLELWPPSRRSGLANLFHYAAREGCSTPPAVVSRVRAELDRRLYWCRDQTQRKHLLAVLGSLESEDALRYAASVLRWEALPYAERQQHKTRHGLHYQREAVSARPVTAAQLRYLSALDHSGPEPENRQATIDLIDDLRKGKGVGDAR